MTKQVAISIFVATLIALSGGSALAQPKSPASTGLFLVSFSVVLVERPVLHHVLFAIGRHSSRAFGLLFALLQRGRIARKRDAIATDRGIVE
jgi:hypothetical protein